MENNIMKKLHSTEQKNGRHRYELLDSIRGITLLSMILYHGAWDIVYLYHVKWDWYHGTGAYIWQQSICWTFILLSGFCWPLSKKPLKRGIIVFGGGILVSVVTGLFLPDSRVMFGVLTFIGSAMLLLIPLDKIFRKIPAEGGVLISFLLFLLTRNVNEGYLGFEIYNLIKLPATWYRGIIMSYLGFPSPAFFSTDYFSLIPWLFLFFVGYFVSHIFQRKGIFCHPVLKKGLPMFSFLGRHSLLIYLLHQPVLYLAGFCFFSVIQ